MSYQYICCLNQTRPLRSRILRHPPVELSSLIVYLFKKPVRKAIPLVARKQIDQTAYLEVKNTSQHGMGILNLKLPLPILAYFLAVALPVHFYAGPLYMTGVRLVLLVMILPLSINLLRGKYGGIFWTDIMFLLHTIWMAVALSVNNPDKVVSQVGSVGVEFLGGYLLARAYVRNVEDFVVVVRLLLTVVCLTLPFAIYEAFTGHPIIIETIQKLPGLTSERVVFAYKRMGLDRAQVMLAHPIHYGLFCSAAFSLTFVGLRGMYSNTRRYLAALAIALCVFFSLSSGALLSVVLQIGLIFWAWSFNRVESRWLLLLGLLAFFYVLIDALSNRAPIQVFMSYATFSAHNAYWRGIIFEWGMKNVWANPVFGIGLNEWVRPWFMFSGSLDNFWLLIAVSYGIPGFIFLALGFFPVLWKVSRRKFGGDQILWQLRLAWVITFVGLSFTLSTVHVWTTIYSFTFFLFGAGMWFMTASPNQSNPENLQDTQQSDGFTYTRRRHSLTNPNVKGTPEPNLHLAEEQAGGRPFSRFPTSHQRTPRTSDKYLGKR